MFFWLVSTINIQVALVQSKSRVHSDFGQAELKAVNRDEGETERQRDRGRELCVCVTYRNCSDLMENLNLDSQARINQVAT